MGPSRDDILGALERVIDPELRRPVTELDMVRDIRIDGGEVAITIALTVAGCPLRASFEEQEQRTKGISLGKETRVLAIASGKGGVGKSSLTANLAAAFSDLGQRTGVLDADVYGHSIPHMLGIRQRPVVVDKMIIPPVKR